MPHNEEIPSEKQKRDARFLPKLFSGDDNIPFDVRKGDDRSPSQEMPDDDKPPSGEEEELKCIS